MAAEAAKKAHEEQVRKFKEAALKKAREDAEDLRVRKRMAIEAARKEAIRKAEQEEQDKINNMSLAEATEYMRENDGKKAKEAAEAKAREDEEAAERKKFQDEEAKKA